MESISQDVLKTHVVPYIQCPYERHPPVQSLKEVNKRFNLMLKNVTPIESKSVIFRFGKESTEETMDFVSVLESWLWAHSIPTEIQDFFTLHEDVQLTYQKVGDPNLYSFVLENVNNLELRTLGVV